MQIGDLVKISDWKGSKPDSRKHGTVLRLDGKHRWSSRVKVYGETSLKREGLAEVLWQDGHTGWILLTRLETIVG